MEERELRQVQLAQLDILRELDRVCRALDVPYYLTAGTLLGVVRHKGFIPWDDDIDVAMRREDYDKLANQAPALLGKEYFWQDSTSEPNFPYYFARLRKTGTSIDEPILRRVEMHQGLYIDIFPLDLCPDDPKAAGRLFKMTLLFTCALLGRVSDEFVCGYTKPPARLAWRLLRRLPNKALFALRDGYRKWAGRKSSGQWVCIAAGRHGYPKESYRREWFGQAVELEFEGQSFPCPNRWHELLTNLYGDYMTPPPPAERQGHFEEG